MISSSTLAPSSRLTTSRPTTPASSASSSSSLGASSSTDDAKAVEDAARDPGPGSDSPRAAAGGHSAQSAGRAAGAAFSPLEDDVPSEDDEDAEEAGIVGLEVVKRLLGATVLEEITVTQEGR